MHAFVAAEDRRFYQHHGVDYQGVLRALILIAVVVAVLAGMRDPARPAMTDLPRLSLNGTP